MSLDIPNLPAGHAIVPPAQHLFHSASPASSQSPFVGGIAGRTALLLAGRSSLGPICRDFETKCAQGDWCCNTGDSCSFDTLNGAFLCCGSSAGANGCARVCAAGTFQCGNVCCTFGETCFGGDTVAGYCLRVNQTPTTLVGGQGQNPQATAGGNGNIRATSTIQTIFATGTRAAGGISTGATRGSSSNLDPNSSDSNGGSGLSLGVVIGVAVAVPAVVIALAIAAWFFLRRCRSRRAQEAAAFTSSSEKHHNASSTSSSPHPSPRVSEPASAPAAHGPGSHGSHGRGVTTSRPFPANLPPNAMIVQTPVTPFEFGQPRTPKTSLPPPISIPETPAPVITDSTSSGSSSGASRSGSGSTPVIATPRLATPINLLNAMAGRRRD